MADNELLKYCHYYKGEDTNPFDGEADDRNMLWFYEQCFASGKNKDSIAEYIVEYEAIGLGSFSADDGVPIGLKALLFNRYAKTSFSMLSAKNPFKEFYLHYYPNESILKNYRYYKGEKMNPQNDGQSFWWRVEHYARDADDKTDLNLSPKMLEYIKHRMWHDGDFGTTTWEEAKARAEEMYEKGTWSHDYLNRRDAVLTDED